MEICVRQLSAPVIQMKKCAPQLIYGILAALIIFPPLPLHGAQPKKLRLAFSAFAYANPPFWIAQELKLFEKYGYDSELIYVGGSRPIQAMLGGSIDVSQVGGAAAVGAAANGAEIAILGTVFTRLTFAIHASPQIKQIAISRARLSPPERRAAIVISQRWRFSDISAGWPTATLACCPPADRRKCSPGCCRESFKRVC